MRLTPYIWNIYKESPNGKKVIKEFAEAAENTAEQEIMFKYNPRMKLLFSDSKSRQTIASMCELFWCNSIYEFPEDRKPETDEQAKEKFINIISSGLYDEGRAIIGVDEYAQMLRYIPWISFLLYYYDPEHFFPYIFLYRAFHLYKIADAFDIELPSIPKKSDYYARCMYYWQLCETFRNFRMANDMTPAELCAFLYDFAPNTIERRESAIPSPSSVWIVGGNINKHEVAETTFWQASPETAKGDILVHYETSPVSAITCLWRSVTDGVIDPFFHYYGNVYMGYQTGLPHITLKELREDKYFSQHPLVRKNFQGVNGWRISCEDYSRLMEIWKSKGADISVLPKLYAPSLPKGLHINLEKDVEEKLLIPMLDSMGWKINRDYIRQVPLKAGRGHRVFPDFALHYEHWKGEYTSNVLIEAKLQMRNGHELTEAFTQARSYAHLLSSSVIMLCDKNCLLIYESKNGFDRDVYDKYYWASLENPDTFQKIKRKLSK